jgi:hypothetical protein
VVFAVTAKIVFSSVCYLTEGQISDKKLRAVTVMLVASSTIAFSLPVSESGMWH